MEVNEPFRDVWAQQFGQLLKEGITLYVFRLC